MGGVVTVGFVSKAVPVFIIDCDGGGIVSSIPLPCLSSSRDRNWYKALGLLVEGWSMVYSLWHVQGIGFNSGYGVFTAAYA